MKTLWERALSAMPGGVNSPVRSFKHVGASPIFMKRAIGCELISEDDTRYIDFCMGFGPHILGHSNPVVVQAVSEQLRNGTSFATVHRSEVELCEEILKSFPFLESVRLVNTGTEAVMTALRLSRAVTGRSKILKFEGCYHGHFDGLLVAAGSGVADLPSATSKGIPQEFVNTTLVARLDEPSTWDKIFSHHEIAAVIVEPVPANEGLYLPPREHLKLLMDLAHKHGALVIFDEVISGFRLGLFGASGAYDLKPDMVTLGKIIGGGLPLSAVVSTKKVMDQLAPQGEVYQAGTFSGNILSVVAGLTCLKELRSNPPYIELERRTLLFTEELTDVLKPLENVSVLSHASMFWVRFGTSIQFPPLIGSSEKARFGEFYRACLKQKIYLPPSPFEVAFLSTAHTDAILVEAIGRMERAVGELT